MVQIVTGIIGIVAVVGYGWTATRLAPYPTPWSPPWHHGSLDGRWAAINAAIRLSVLAGVAALVAWPYVQGGPTGWAWSYMDGVWFSAPVYYSKADATWLVVTLAAAGLIALGLLIVRLGPVRQRHQRTSDVPASASGNEPTLSELTDDALQALISERDPRLAILACYAQMERALARRGMPRNPDETAMEYARRVLERTGALRSPLRSLTSLFHVAGFSAQPMDEAMREMAVRSLRAIRGMAQ
jgi:Domain of unknown function (DUF4129)